MEEEQNKGATDTMMLAMKLMLQCHNISAFSKLFHMAGSPPTAVAVVFVILYLIINLHFSVIAYYIRTVAILF